MTSPFFPAPGRKSHQKLGEVVSELSLDRQDVIYYVSSMKTKTSITLSEDLVREMDMRLGRSGNRSAFVEQALRAFLTAKAQQTRNAKDLEILNRHANRLNKEAQDVLSYQVEL